MFTIPRIGSVHAHLLTPIVATISLIWTEQSEWLLIWIGLWFAALTHGIGHGIAAVRMGELPSSITIYPFFSTFRMIRPPMKNKSDMIITAAGPLANSLIGGLLLGSFHQIFGGEPQWLGQWARIQIGYGMVCLLPMYPLDGSRLLRLVLQLRKPESKALETANFVGQATAAATVLWSFYQRFFMLGLVGIGMYLVSRFARFFQLLVKNMNLIERRSEGEVEGDAPDADGESTINMTMTPDGVWQQVESSPSHESRAYF